MSRRHRRSRGTTNRPSGRSGGGELERFDCLGRASSGADEFTRQTSSIGQRKKLETMSALAEPRRPSFSSSFGGVAELQGLYGPFSFPEKLLQKIWLQGEFDRTQCVALNGRKISIVDAGRWNLLGGPDFKSTRLRFENGEEIVGDVEIHLHASDWKAHRHAEDPAYNEVVLHVVLFPPPPEHTTIGADGRAIPVLVLLPLLWHDLEEYAAEQAVETLANRPASQIIEKLGPLSAEALSELLTSHTQERWRQKVRFARLRVERLGWEAACHQTALEILGYRFNRAPMLRIATAFGLPFWTTEQDCNVDAVFETERGRWKVQGIRPANFPRVRLQQYANWTRTRRDWPGLLATWSAKLPEIAAEAPTAVVRRTQAFSQLRQRLSEEISGGVLKGTRFDNLVCDGCLPLIATKSVADSTLFGVWFHWFAGDLPPIVLTALRQLRVFDRRHPVCHGPAQGLLGWLIACERTALGHANSLKE